MKVTAKYRATELLSHIALLVNINTIFGHFVLAFCGLQVQSLDKWGSKAVKVDKNSNLDIFLEKYAQSGF